MEWSVAIATMVSRGNDVYHCTEVFEQKREESCELIIEIRRNARLGFVCNSPQTRRKSLCQSLQTDGESRNCD